jgi:hypothetical protein
MSVAAVGVAFLLGLGAGQAGAWPTAPSSVSTDFSTYSVGNLNGQDGWFNDAATLLTVSATGGVVNSACVSSGNNAAVWTTKGFSWTNDVATGYKYIARMDFQASGNTVATAFDDDRVGWTYATQPSTSSTNHLGVQLDNTDQGGGIVSYWKISGTTKTRLIATFPTLTTGTWYRLEADFTKLTATSAKIDVSFVALDASGNPTGTVTTGSIADTSLGTDPCPASYFNATTMYPIFKNYQTQTGKADNAYFQITPEPATLALLGIGGLVALLRRRGRK